MNKLFLVLFSFSFLTLNAQIPAYYNGVNFSLTGIPLKNELATKITSTHTNQISYTQVWTVLKQSDLDPTNSANVLLVYGWDDSDVDETNDRSRDKNANGGTNTGEWNREHIYPKSLGTPDLGTSGPGSDAHNLKPADVGYNGTRGNKKYATGSGTSGVVGANWYPGDEWKGDIARIYMYMYVRYNTRCKPGNACVGNPNTIDLNMVNLLLEWNIADPVSAYETNRNNKIFNTQGNRNPFIDNPYLATLIWGGQDAENNWVELGEDEKEIEFSIYPNPSTDGSFHIKSESYNQIKSIHIFDISGKVVHSLNSNEINSNNLLIKGLSNGIYFAKVTTDSGVLTKKIVIKQ